MLVVVPVTTNDGVAVNVVIAGATVDTPTVVWALWLPAELLQVSVKVVLVDNITLVVSPDTTAPTPSSMKQSGIGEGWPLYVQVQVMVAAVPTTTDIGVAVKVLITGGSARSE